MLRYFLCLNFTSRMLPPTLRALDSFPTWFSGCFTCFGRSILHPCTWAGGQPRAALRPPSLTRRAKEEGCCRDVLFTAGPSGAASQPQGASAAVQPRLSRRQQRYRGNFEAAFIHKSLPSTAGGFICSFIVRILKRVRSHICQHKIC